MPLNIIEHKGDTDVANIDKVLVVCSALTNLGEPIMSVFMYYSCRPQDFFIA